MSKILEDLKRISEDIKEAKNIVEDFEGRLPMLPRYDHVRPMLQEVHYKLCAIKNDLDSIQKKADKPNP